MKKMRNDRLQKLRKDLNTQILKEDENDMLSESPRSKTEHPKLKASPKFKTVESSLRTLDGYINDLPQRDRGEALELNKEGTAQFGGIT